jgi:hypothetical protein
MKEIFFTLNYRFSGVAEDQWQDLFDSPACKVTKTEDDSYCLTACRLEKLKDYNSAVEAAKKLVTMLIAFTKIEFNTDIQRIEPHELCFIYSLRDDVGDKTNVFVFSGEVIVLEVSVAGGTVIIRDIDGRIVPQAPQAPQEHWFDYYLNQCDDEIDSTIFDVLAYFARTASWYNLYKILELILWDVDKKSENKAKEKIVNNGWIDEWKLDDFTYAATYYDFLVQAGAENVYLDESRHTEGYFQRKSKGKPIRTNIMHKPEAKNVIGNLIRNWLKSKIISI